MPTIAVLEKILADADRCSALVAQPVANPTVPQVTTPIFTTSTDDPDENILVTQMNTEVDGACIAFNGAQAATSKQWSDTKAAAQAVYDATMAAADQTALAARQSAATTCNQAVAT